jgi:hypothetical protein
MPDQGCVAQVPQHRLMCRRHWNMVPKALQWPVYRSWDLGRGAGTEAHVAAMRAAVQAVSDQIPAQGSLL